MDWLGRAKLTYYASSAPMTIKSTDGSSTDLVTVCRRVVPAPRLNPLLFNGHLQTCWTAVALEAPPVHYKRRLFEASHGRYPGTFAVDFVTGDAVPADSGDDTLPENTAYLTAEEEDSIGSDDARPMLIVLHGLSGGSHEVYLRHGIAPLLESGQWEACVVNSRGCAKSKITTGLLYNARATWDLRQTVQWLSERFPNRPLFGLGFSLGGCILTNYAGEEGESCKLKAAMVCANPWNLEVSNLALNRTFIGHHLYARVLGTAMRRLAETHRAELEKWTNFNFETLDQCTFLHEFDREVQCKAWGYPTESAYYRDASSVESSLGIRIPFLAINSVDDPIVSPEAFPTGEVQKNPHVVFCTTSLGGHLGWFEVDGGRWHSKPIANFMNYMAFQTDLGSLKPLSNGNNLGTLAKEYEPMRRKMQFPRK